MDYSFSNIFSIMMALFVVIVLVVLVLPIFPIIFEQVIEPYTQWVDEKYRLFKVKCDKGKYERIAEATVELARAERERREIAFIDEEKAHRERLIDTIKDAIAKNERGLRDAVKAA